MKIAIVGGAGVRAPMLIGALAKRAAELNIEQVSVLDIDPRKRRILLTMVRHQLETQGFTMKLRDCETPQEAFEGADYVITTIRPGFEAGRVLDERVAVNLGVIGQETTGPGGFAFAGRSIPAILEYARIFFAMNPKGWIINFTNPAGLVTQALHKSGYSRAVGICDSADNASHHVVDYLKVPHSSIVSRVYGLNHLSWTDSVLVDGHDVLPELLANDDFLRKAQPYFTPEEIRRRGTFLNEYLYYYYHTDETVKALMAEEKLRGELVAELNEELLSTLETLVDKGDYTEALDFYFGYNRRRIGSYMEYARSEERHIPKDEEEGYAGVALAFIQAILGETQSRVVLSVPQNGALGFLKPEDVAEISCTVSASGIRTIAPGPVPDENRDLITAVKAYERAAVDAILERSIAGGVEALTANPLVPNRDMAKKLMDGYLEAHRQYYTDWK